MAATACVLSLHVRAGVGSGQALLRLDYRLYRAECFGEHPGCVLDINGGFAQHCHERWRLNLVESLRTSYE